MLYNNTAIMLQVFRIEWAIYERDQTRVNAGRYLLVAMETEGIFFAEDTDEDEEGGRSS